MNIDHTRNVIEPAITYRNNFAINKERQELIDFDEMEDPVSPGDFKVSGTITFDVTTLTSDFYIVSIISASHGVFSDTTWMDVYTSGGGGGTDITFNPTFLDFGDVTPSTTADIDFDITNNGTAAVDITFDNSHPQLSIDPATFNISGGATHTFTVTFSPPAEGGFYDGGFDIVVDGTEYIPVGWQGNSPTGGGAITVDGMDLMAGAGGTGTELWVYGDNFSESEVSQLELQFDGGLFDDWPTAELTITPSSIMALMTSDISTFQNGDYQAFVSTNSYGTLNTPMYNFTGGGGTGG
ncbi:MAG: hypothetical protein GY869_31925, partial [Planctomycetes bacterium]|nr:hypothetical protein [Planctomycetota bacterium]